MNKSNSKETPIALTIDEVRAVLEGRKSHHRVLIDTSDEYGAVAFIDCGNGWKAYHSEDGESALVDDGVEKPYLCPLGNVGDRLWVKEEHRPVGWSFDDGEVCIEYKDGKKLTHNYLTEEELELNPNDDYLIEVCDELIDRDVPIIEGTDMFDMSKPDNMPNWRNSEVMPRFASRLLLEITDVRVERVQDNNDWAWVINFKVL